MSIAGKVAIEDNPNLQEVDFSKMSSIGGALEFGSNGNLAQVSLPAFEDFSAGFINFLDSATFDICGVYKSNYSKKKTSNWLKVFEKHLNKNIFLN